MWSLVVVIYVFSIKKLIVLFFFGFISLISRSLWLLNAYSFLGEEYLCHNLVDTSVTR